MIPESEVTDGLYWVIETLPTPSGLTQVTPSLVRVSGQSPFLCVETLFSGRTYRTDANPGVAFHGRFFIARIGVPSDLIEEQLRRRVEVPA